MQHMYIDENGIQREAVILEPPRRTADGVLVHGAVAYIEVPSLSEELNDRARRNSGKQIFRTYARWVKPDAPTDAKMRNTVREVVAEPAPEAPKKAPKKKTAKKAKA